ncbi:hypothetical protein HDU98_001085 [Podochytrium sp. JEL0797]|nr:hypothetical protein HDU98_001085 [Podochytrium sp. JEL0797]
MKSKTLLTPLSAEINHAVSRLCGTNHLPLSFFQGVFSNSEYGSMIIFHQENRLFFDLKASGGNPDLAGVLGRWKDSNTILAVFELPLLGYKDYTNPQLFFEFVVDEKSGGITGFLVNLDDKHVHFDKDWS